MAPPAVAASEVDSEDYDSALPGAVPMKSYGDQLLVVPDGPPARVDSGTTEDALRRLEPIREGTNEDLDSALLSRHLSPQGVDCKQMFLDAQETVRVRLAKVRGLRRV